MLNFNMQYYKSIPLRLINRKYGKDCRAKRYAINKTNQNVWIPNKHLEEDGTIRIGEDIDYVFRRSQNQLRYAGVTWAIPGIKRANKSHKDC